MSSDPDLAVEHHPPLQPGFINAPHRRIALGRMKLESGEFIDDAFITCAIHGDLADASLPVVVALSAIGGTHHRLDFLIGEDRALDARAMRIVAIDALGNGLSVSPSNSRTQPRRAFPRFTIRDMVASQSLAMSSLGIERIDLVIGASMGGMQALQWGVSHPQRAMRIVAMTPMARTPAWSVSINTLARALLAPALAEGAERERSAESDGAAWRDWVTLMQLVAMRTPHGVDGAFATAAALAGWIDQRTAWWGMQGFDALDWLYQSWAYDDHDLGTTPGFAGDTAAALASIRAPVFIGSAALDLYNPADAAAFAAAHIHDVEHHVIDSPWGHLAASSADAASAQSLNRDIGEFLRRTGMLRTKTTGVPSSPGH